MSYSANLFQITQLAVKAEKAGDKFYRHLAAKQPDGQVRKILSFFAQQEQEHAEFFQGIADETQGRDSEHSFPIDVIRLMKEGIEQIEKGGWTENITPGQPINLKTALEIAWEIEQQTIRIYTALQNALDEKHNVTIYKIINEESKHAQMIKNVMQQAHL